MSTGSILTPWRCRILVTLAILAAYLVPLWNAEFHLIDDPRFTFENPHIRELSPDRAARFFTDKTTLDGRGMWEGTYRPIRTLDFAIDWALSGENPRTFHLHNLLYHLLGSVLVFELFRRLCPGGLGGPLLGSLLFALHPAHTECVAWITSRGDLLVLLFVVGAALLHLARRYAWSAVVFALALLSKEGAVVFPAAVLFLDLLVRGRGTGSRLVAAVFRTAPSGPEPRGEMGSRPGLGEVWRQTDLPWVPYLVYGVLTLAYFLLWQSMMPHSGHLKDWWGGSYGANLLTMARGLAYYVRNLLLPVLLLYDYYVPTTSGADLGAVIGILLLAGILIGCVRGSALFRFAVAWFFLTMLPMSNLIHTVGIPTAERFLYLPSVGFALWAGNLAARVRPVRAAVAGSLVVVLCFGGLTFTRAGVWGSSEAFLEDGLSKARTPMIRVRLAHNALGEAHAAHEAIQSGNRDPALAEIVRTKAEEVLALADEQMDELENTLRMQPGAAGGNILSKAANALILLDRPEEAYATALRAIGFLREAGVVEPHPHFNAGLAARRLALGGLAGIDLKAPLPADRPALLHAAEYLTEAAESLTRAREAGYPDRDLRGTILANFAGAADLRVRALPLGGTAARNAILADAAGRDFLRAAVLAEELGKRQDAASLYRRCLDVTPDDRARSALRRLSR